MSFNDMMQEVRSGVSAVKPTFFGTSECLKWERVNRRIQVYESDRCNDALPSTALSAKTTSIGTIGFPRKELQISQAVSHAPYKRLATGYCTLHSERWPREAGDQLENLYYEINYTWRCVGTLLAQIGHTYETLQPPNIVWMRYTYIALSTPVFTSRDNLYITMAHTGRFRPSWDQIYKELSAGLLYGLSTALWHFRISEEITIPRPRVVKPRQCQTSHVDNPEFCK